jgi:hypothetical protein
MSDQGTTRREVIKKAVYVTPLLITLKANLEFASTGSGLAAPSDYVLTGGSGPPASGTVPPDTTAPGGAPPPPLHDPPPAEHAGPDDAAPPAQDDPVADHPGKRRRLRRHSRRYVL